MDGRAGVCRPAPVAVNAANQLAYIGEPGERRDEMHHHSPTSALESYLKISQPRRIPYDIFQGHASAE